MALYDDIMAAETAPPLGADPRFNASLELNTDFNPDEVAKQRGVARQIGVPVAAVEAMPAESMKAARIKQIDTATAAAPITRAKFTDEDFTKLAHDDAESLSGMELAMAAVRRVSPLTDISSAALTMLGQRQDNRLEQQINAQGQRGAVNLIGGATVGLGAQLMDVGAVAYDALSAATSWALPEDVFGRQAANARAGANRARESLDVLQGGKAANSTQAALDSGLRSTGTNLAMLPVGIETAMVRGAEYASHVVAGMMASGVGAEAFNKARDQGMDRVGAATYAVPQAVFEYAFEQVPASRLLNDIAKNSGLLRTVANQIVPEVLGEQATTILQDLNEQVRLNPDKTFKQFIEERPDAAYQTLIATLVGIGTQSTVVKAFAPAQQAAMQRSTDIQQNTQDVEQLQDLFTRAASNKLRERDPQTFQDLVQTIADSDTNAAPSTVFIDGAALTETLQQAGITDAQLAEMLPSVPSQLAQANTAGGTVEIPLGELMARVAGTGLEQQLLQHIRTTPDALSQVEAKEAATEAANMLAADAQRVIADSAVGVERATSAAVVQENILGQLRSTGRFTDDVNTAYAALVRDFYTATSARLNLTPEQLYQQYPLQIGATAPTGTSFTLKTLRNGNTQEQHEGKDVENGSPLVAQIERDKNGKIINVRVIRPKSKGITEVVTEFKTGLNDSNEVLSKELASVFVKTPTALNQEDRPPALFDTTINDKQGNPFAMKVSRTLIGMNRDTESVMVEARDAQGLRRGVIDFAVRPDGTIAAENTIVAGPYRGQGIAQAMYQAAKDAGYKIVPGRAQTEEGAGMVRSLQAKGLIGDGVITPTSTYQQSVQQTETPEFKAWFGDSKVVDAEGKPLVIYHGTNKKFTKFNIKKATQGIIWFTSDRSAIEAGEVGAQGAGHIMEMYASIKNPAGWKEYDQLGIDQLISRGYDGVLLPEGDGTFVGFAFESSQFKDANRNSGAFNPNDPNILNQQARGTFDPANLSIALLERADLSTFLHELGHFFLEVQADLASQPNAPSEIVGDMGTLLKWFGVPDLATWRSMSLEQQRASHEKFAESFEQYLFEGKAPSRELQALFGRFRAWMINVYRSLSEFMREHNTQLTDDVRGVFDRLLADADQIGEAQRAASYQPLFESVADSGMSLEEWEAYQRTGAKATTDALDTLQARSLRDMQWLANARSKVLSKLQSEAKAKRKAVEAEVTAEVDAEPAYAAMRWLKTGVLPDGTETNGAKLSTTALRDMYGDNPAAPWRYLSTDMIAAQEGLHPDVAAEILGFESGDQLVREIVNAQPRAVEIEGRTDQRMLERYGDIATPQAQQRAANEAVHNDARARFIATELRALQDATNPREQVGTARNGRAVTVNALVEAAKQFATRMVAQRKVRDIKPAQHAAAEQRAGTRVQKAMVTGDTTAAITAKRDQLLNNFATKLSYDALTEVDSKVKYLNRVADSDTLPADYKDQIDKLLDRYDIRRSTTLTEIDRRASLVEWVEAQRENGIEPSIPPELLNEAQRLSYKEMTLEEFRGLVDSVKQIEHLGRLKNKLLTAKDERDFAQVRDLMVNGIVANGKGRQADVRTPNTVLGEALVGLKKFWANHIKAATWARVMDGGKDGGPVWEYLIRAGNDAGNKETSMVAKSTQDLAALVAPVLKAGKMGGKGVFFPTINRSMNREAVLAMALNTGNDSNTQRLLGGEGWTADQIRPVLDTLTAEDWRFVQGVWDYFESFRPEIAAKERRVNGVEPAWIPAVARTEKGVQLRGGYYPVKYDTRASERAEAHADAEAAKAQMKGAYTSATTRRSFTKERVDAVNGRPLLYSMDGLYSGVQEVIHDLSWHEFLIDANRLLKDKAISATMRNTYGPDAHAQFKSWLQDTAQGYAQANGNTEAFAGFIRRGVSVSGLGFNLMSALIQPVGLTQSVVRLGGRYVAKGVAEYIANPIALKDKINEKSEFMRTRSMTRLREIAEVRTQVKGVSKARQAIDGSAYFLMMQAQSVVDMPTWWAGYEKAIGEGNNEERAVALADQGVIDSQGSGGIKDQAAIERGGPTLKLFTVFYSFFNTTLNNAVATGMTTDNKAKLAADYALLFVIPTILTALLKDALTPGDSGDWDDPKKIAKKLIGEQISFMFGMMVGVRETSAAIQVATGTNQYGSDYSGPAGVRPVADLVKLGKQVNQGEMDDGLRKAIINTAGELLRLPAAQINRSITGAKALADGKTSNPAALLTGFQEKRD